MGTVTNSNNRLTDADATTGWASDGAGGAGPQNEPDLGYQLTSGSNLSVSRKIGTTKGGFAYTHGSTVDMTAVADQVCMYKCVWYNSINAVAYPACGIKIGNASSNSYEYAVIDDGAQGDLDPDPKRLVYIIPVDPNVTAWPDQIQGTVTVTTIDFFGIQGDFGGSAKAENVAMDAVDLVGGTGVLWLTGSASVFDDFVAHDEGTIANRFGHWSTVRQGVLETFGTSWIGRDSTPTATSTQFTDSALTILYGPGFFDAGFTGLGIDLGHASTTVDLTDVILKGQGQNGHKIYFDTITEVDPTPDELTLSPAPGYITAVPVIYNNDGGSDSIGLTSGNEYWLERVTDTTFNVHTTRHGARTAATPVALSDGSTGEAHYIQRTPDIRPDLTIVGTSGTATVTRCTFDGWRNLELTTAITFTSCIFRGCDLIDITTNNGGSLQACSFTGQTTEPGVALVQCDTTANIDDCTFTLAGDEAGHAIEVDATGTKTLTGNTLTGYWISPDNEAGAEFDTTSGVGVDATGEDVTTTGNHGFSTGDEVYYNDNGGTDTIGLTDGARYYANVISATNFSLHRSKHNANADSNRIPLNATGTGEIHTFYSGKAAIVNTSGGAVTLQVSNGGTPPSVRNVGAASTTIQNNITLTVTPVLNGSEVRIYTAGTSTELDGVESVTGGAFAASIPASTNVDIIVIGPVTDFQIPVRIESVQFAGSQNFDPQQRSSLVGSDPAGTPNIDPNTVGGLLIHLDTSVISSMWTNTGKTTQVASDGDQIQAIDDLSGNANHHVFQTTAPVYRPSQFNTSYPTAEFAGGSHEWRIASFTQATPCTLFVVLDNDDTVIAYVASSGSGASNRALLQTETSGAPVGPGFYDGTHTAFHTSAITTANVWEVVFESPDSSTARLFLNGVEHGSGTSYTGWSNATSLWRIGGAGTTPDFDLSEFRLYDRQLSTAERLAIREHLQSKWGL